MDKKYNVEEMKNFLKGVVNERRYEHSLRVADEAVKLAKIYNLDVDKTYITALNHDIAKDFSDDENKRLIEKYNLDKRILDDNYRNVIHADIGAVFVKEKYDFDDDMCKAIKYHAFGNIEMDMLAKVIFIADKTGRKELSDEGKKIKDMSYKNIDKAIIMYIDELRKSLIERGLKEQEETKALYDLLMEKNPD